MNRKILYLLNPISGTGNKKAVRELIEEKTRESGIDFIIQDTVKDGDYSFLRQKIQNENFTDIVMCGGDGTVNQVLASLHSSNIQFGIIPLGSGNGLARGARIPMNTKRALSLILNSREALSTDAFEVNGKFGCMLTGLGFDAMVAHDFAGRKVRGFFTYARRSLALFFGCRPYRFKIKCSELTTETDAFFISIANSNQFGNEVTIAPVASLNDGLLDVVLVNKMNKLGLIFKLLWQIRMGKVSNNTSKKNINYLHTKSIVIENLNNAPLHIDGEPAETAALIEIRVLPRGFRLIRP